MVPGGGIEPPTRGFSIHCSTPELPGHRNDQAVLASLGSGVLDVGGGGVQRELCEKQVPSAVSGFLPAAVGFRGRRHPLDHPPE